VSRVVENEFFAFQIEKHVRKQADAYLASRVKAAIAALALTVTALGWLGVQKYYAFTAIVEGLEADGKTLRAKAERLTGEAQRVEALIAQANGAVAHSRSLLELADKNVSATRTISEGASHAARQTGDLAQAVLQQAQSTQQNVQARDEQLQTNMAQASNVLAELRSKQVSLESINAAAVAIKDIRSEVTQRSAEIMETSKAVIQRNAALEKGLHFEQELAKAKTFEILLIRDGHAAEVRLPDFRRSSGDDARPSFKIRVETRRIKRVVDFSVWVNDSPAQDFNGLAVGDMRSLVDAPFTVRVDSIYHAKLAFDFVVLRINPRDGAIAAPATVTATKR
jgi:hypothetical protein